MSSLRISISSILLLHYLSFVLSSGFLSVGDWGSASLGGYHYRNAFETSTAMKSYTTADFVLNTGDNFYYCGIQNTSDPQIDEDYLDLFGSMKMDWYNSLGNHDYGFSPESQIILNTTIPNWIMDDRYYHRKVMLNNSLLINIIVLDTNPCISDYRGTDRRHWDPCGTEYPDCSPIPEPCRFHENIIAQDCNSQLVWANRTLNEINDGEWVFVVGHHKAEEIDVVDFQTTIFDNPRVHLYLNGHNHNLEYYEINGQAKYMTTGAGGMVIIGETHIHTHKSAAHTHTNTPQIKSIWSKVVTGFASHTFMNDGNSLLTEFWDVKKNESIYSFEIKL